MFIYMIKCKSFFLNTSIVYFNHSTYDDDTKYYFTVKYLAASRLLCGGSQLGGGHRHHGSLVPRVVAVARQVADEGRADGGGGGGGAGEGLPADVGLGLRGRVQLVAGPRVRVEGLGLGGVLLGEDVGEAAPVAGVVVVQLLAGGLAAVQVRAPHVVDGVCVEGGGGGGGEVQGDLAARAPLVDQVDLGVEVTLDTRQRDGDSLSV